MESPRLNLADISTRWTSVQDPQRFVLRYSPAILAYLEALLRDPDLARDVAQDFYLKFVERGLPTISHDRGRFRDYLKVAVRNAALSELRKRRPHLSDQEVLAALADEATVDADEKMRRAWTNCVLDKLWRTLEQHEHLHPGNHAYQVLKVSLDYPHEDSQQQADRVAQLVGQPLSAVAFRKQRSRARQLAAQVLLDEVRATLRTPSNECVEAELADLELLELLREYLADDAGN